MRSSRIITSLSVRVCEHVPELPEARTQAERLDHARGAGRNTISVVLEEHRERGQPMCKRVGLIEAREIARGGSAMTPSPISALTEVDAGLQGTSVGRSG
jgi:hypothetical protein